MRHPSVLLMQPRWGSWRNDDRCPGCAARPWALRFSTFGAMSMLQGALALRYGTFSSQDQIARSALKKLFVARKHGGCLCVCATNNRVVSVWVRDEYVRCTLATRLLVPKPLSKFRRDHPLPGHCQEHSRLRLGSCPGSPPRNRQRDSRREPEANWSTRSPDCQANWQVL